MPKMKTKKAAAKRFKVRPSGKVSRGHANKSHILTKKDRGRKNKLKKQATMKACDVGRVRDCLPYG